MIMNSRVYDVLTYIAAIILPALSALYAALAGIWGLPYAVEITGTIMAIDTFLGALLKVSKSKYDKENSNDFDASFYDAEDDYREEE